MEGVRALDFGGWGRNLRIGEHYARKLLEARAMDAKRTSSATPHDAMPRILDSAQIERTAHQLVYGYTHHPFPIDYNEAARLGLRVKQMSQEVYEGALDVLAACRGKDFVGFLSREGAERESKARHRVHDVEAPHDTLETRADEVRTGSAN